MMTIEAIKTAITCKSYDKSRLARFFYFSYIYIYIWKQVDVIEKKLRKLVLHDFFFKENKELENE